MKRLSLFALLALTAGTLIFASGQAERSFPQKPITIVCPWSAGGGTDRTARFIAEQLSEVIGQPVNVVNETGGAGAVGHSAAATAAPDGYTIGNLTFEVNTLSYLGYSDITPNDFIPLLQFNQDPAAVTVGADAPYDSVTELLDAVAASDDGEFAFSGSGIGTVWDLARISMLDMYGID